MHTRDLPERAPTRMLTGEARFLGPAALPAQVFLGESDSLLHVHQLESSEFKAEPQVPPLTLYILPLHRPSKGTAKAHPHVISSELSFCFPRFETICMYTDYASVYPSTEFLFTSSDIRSPTFESHLCRLLAWLSLGKLN